MKIIFLALLPPLLLGACAQTQVVWPPAIGRQAATPESRTEAVGSELAQAAEQRQLTVSNAPIPETSRSAGAESQSSTSGAGAAERVTVTIEQMTIKAFAQFVFGTLLKKSVALDAKLEQRTDLITLKSDTPQLPRQLADTAKLLLQGYGVSVQEFDSLVRVVAADGRTGELPLVRRGRASAEVPSALRPVFHLVEMEATKSIEMIGWLKAMFGARVEFQDDPNHNSILLSGAPENVSAALEIIRTLDQPRMRGRIAKRLNPSYLAASELVARLSELLAAQGYSVASQPAAGPSSAVMLVPVTSLNTVFLFTASEAVADLVVNWAIEIDQPAPSAVGMGFFSFPVRYSDAQSLAKTMTDLIAGGSASAATTAQQQGTVARPPARVVVNAASNSVLIQGGTPEEHRQWRSLLTELDRPVKSALIDVVVAEVTLGAKENLGIEWTTLQSVANGNTVTGGTLGGLGLGTGGLSLSLLNSAGAVRGLLNFLGSSSDAKVLSSPKLLTRNAETASITVGQEVPIVTSQQSTATSTSPSGTLAGVLQTIQYRSTGVILRVKPVILAGGRLDLELVQEVSSAAQTTSGVTTSPTIATRRVETKLSLRDGGTVMIAGLISSNSSKGNSGVPGLKDIPGIGAFFRAENKSLDKTELIILITAHIVNDDFEAEAITESFRQSLSPWMKAGPGPAADAANDPGVRNLRLRPQATPAAGRPSAAPAAEMQPKAAMPAVVKPPRQPDPEVMEAPKSGRAPLRNADLVPAPARQPGAPATAPNPAPARPGDAPAPSSEGRPVTDPKLLEELNRAIRK